MLKNAVAYYNWVGFYAVDNQKPDELKLVVYEGRPTEHIRISFGKGVCGRAATLGKRIVAQDVSKESNYLSCNSKVKSEIVIPIFRNRKIVGEIDIDSYEASPFTVNDEILLKRIAEMTRELL